MLMNFGITVARTLGSGRRPGFSMIELAIVLVIAGIMASFTIPNFNQTARMRMAQNARDSFVWMGAQARSRAIEMGTTWLLEVDPISERAWIVRRNPTLATDTLKMVNFVTEFGATITTSTSNKVTLCFNSRGYAWPCNTTTSPTAAVNVTFSHAQRTATARVRPLGQMVRL
jgi:prepilin-type N-terminal cleavage/methylation domain-containing protein